MTEVRIAIVGVGNCASSLVQGLTYYEDADPKDRVPGLMHVDLGGYHVGDVKVVAAFDVDLWGAWKRPFLSVIAGRKCRGAGNLPEPDRARL